MTTNNSQPAPAVPDAVRRLPDEFDKQADVLCPRGEEGPVDGFRDGLAEGRRECANSLRKALATHPADGDSPAVPDWRPIETAPKDGTEILIRGYFKDRKYTTDVYHDWWNRHDLQWTRWPHVDSPTHWMPIPPLAAAPTPTDDGEK